MIKKIPRKLIYEYSLRKFKKKWRQLNSHNFTTIKALIDITKVKIGKGTYGCIEIVSFGNPMEGLEIGHYCSIAKNVKFLLGGNHQSNCLSTYPFTHFYCNKNTHPGLSKGKIIISNDVWIGMDTLILSGVKIGQGAIIGARSVIANDIPPYAIVIGNPGKIIKYRFNQNIIDKIIESNIFEKIGSDFINEKSEFFTQELTESVLSEFLIALHE